MMLYRYMYNHLDTDFALSPRDINSTYSRLIMYLLIMMMVHVHTVTCCHTAGAAQRYIRTSDIKWLILSLMTPHCIRVIHKKDVAALADKYPAAYNLLRERVKLEQPQAVKFEWQSHRERRDIHFDKPVISQEQKVLNDPNWLEVKPCVFMDLMNTAVSDKLPPIQLWYMIHRLRAVLPCTVAHLKLVFDNHSVKYPSNWMDLTTSISAKDKPHMPAPNIHPFSKPGEIITKLLWVAVHAMLMGIPSITELLPVDGYINDNSHEWKDLEAALLSTTRSPRVMVDAIKQ
jgi:hypothetical protein